MKKYFIPTTKVVTVNVKNIMETEIDTTSENVVPDDNTTEAPLF